MSALNEGLFWKDTFERAIKTVAQTMVALLTADGIMDVLSVDWGQIASIAGLAGLISVLTSIASAGSGNSASLVVDAKEKK